MRLRVLLFVLLGASIAAAQLPPCFRSKYSNEWPIRVKEVELLDGKKLSAAERSLIIRELKRECGCWPCALTDEVSEQIREMYQWYGYFQAVANVDIRKLGIDSYSIKARVQEGPQYRLHDITFSNLKAFPAAEVRKFFPLQAGDLYDTRAIQKGMARLRQLYSTRGYLNFTPVPDTTVNPAAGTIAVRIDIEEGQVFKVGALLLAGLEPRRGFGRKLLDEWRPLMGKIYNSEVVDGFIHQNLAGIAANPPQITYMQDVKAGTVALKVEFQTLPMQ